MLEIRTGQFYVRVISNDPKLTDLQMPQNQDGENTNIKNYGVLAPSCGKAATALVKVVANHVPLGDEQP